MFSENRKRNSYMSDIGESGSTCVVVVLYVLLSVMFEVVDTW